MSKEKIIPSMEETPANLKKIIDKILDLCRTYNDEWLEQKVAELMAQSKHDLHFLGLGLLLHYDEFEFSPQIENEIVRGAINESDDDLIHAACLVSVAHNIANQKISIINEWLATLSPEELQNLNIDTTGLRKRIIELKAMLTINPDANLLKQAFLEICLERMHAEAKLKTMNIINHPNKKIAADELGEIDKEFNASLKIPLEQIEIAADEKMDELLYRFLSDPGCFNQSAWWTIPGVKACSRIDE